MDDLLHAIPDLIALIPEPWDGLVISLLALAVTLSGLLAAAKPKLGAPTDSDQRWRRRMFKVIAVLDSIAINSEPVGKKARRVKAEKTVERLTSIPPAPHPFNSEE